jgi:hypothetical protein
VKKSETLIWTPFAMRQTIEPIREIEQAPKKTRFSLTTDNRQPTTIIRSQIFVAAAFVFQTMEFDVGGYERTVT